MSKNYDKLMQRAEALREATSNVLLLMRLSSGGDQYVYDGGTAVIDDLFAARDAFEEAYPVAEVSP